MIKSNKGKLTLEGSSRQLAAETAVIIKHIFTTIAKEDKIAAAAAYKTVAETMADAAEALVEKYGISLDDLNADDDDEEDEFDSALRSFIDNLSVKEVDTLIAILDKFSEEREDD